MTARRVKLYGVNNLELASFRSLLSVAATRLNNQWSLTEGAQADIAIYDIDTDLGREAFEVHHRGLQVVMSQSEQPADLADAQLKKPVRVKHLTTMLNTLDERISFALQGEKVRQSNTTPPSDPEVDPNRFFSSVKKTTLLHSVAKQLNRRKTPAADLPSLAIYCTEPVGNPPATILNTKTFKQWLATLTSHEPQQQLLELHAQLKALNQTQLDAEQRIALLECYRDAVQDFIFVRDIDSVKLEISQPKLFDDQAQQLADFIDSLAMGYKYQLMSAYRLGQRPQTDPLYLLTIIRAAELISLAIVHAFRHYHAPPAGAMHELHQLYIYCEAADVLDKKVSLRVAGTKKPFSHYYFQIILTSIADPYSLAKYDVFRLFKLMAKLSDTISIAPLSEGQSQQEILTPLANHFCLACAHDQLPLPLHRTDLAIRQEPKSRLLNLYAFLSSVEQLFDALEEQALEGYDVDIQLLKKVIPQFNSSYERQFERLKAVPHRTLNLVNGLDDIYRVLTDNDNAPQSQWDVINEGFGGLMIRSYHHDAPLLHIGDFLGLFEQDQPVCLATVRWYRIDNNESVYVGLQIHTGHPVAAELQAPHQTTVIKALSLPASDDIHQKASLIVEKGKFSPQRSFQLMVEDKTYTIQAQHLLDNSINYEQFDYKVLSDP